jgi:hypothetical protein
VVGPTEFSPINNVLRDPPIAAVPVTLALQGDCGYTLDFKRAASWADYSCSPNEIDNIYRIEIILYVGGAYYKTFVVKDLCGSEHMLDIMPGVTLAPAGILGYSM